jgi:protein SCO1
MPTRRSAFATAFVIALCSCAAAAATPLPSLPGVYVNPEPVGIADFTLTDHDGKPRSFSSLRGAPVLVFFGFTHCPKICPDAMARLRLLHDARDGALAPARVVLVSVDGERDTPAALRKFLQPQATGFIGLTGDPKTTAGIAARFSAVFFKAPAAKDGSYDVMHSAQVFAVDRQGRLRASFSGASLDDMATITAQLLAER